ncbi:hypothetical protein N1027_11645 [Herbiconiux sp. CPCC 205763]|uniref:DUF4332 domain-containing protein n=1 Tax=Herbiconiux aconitum TaxID=2970913 RepID=A0ABT2GT94_9MICO|nr:HTH domain-containing protein [Herbiconiux aconitum]MCS5718787.1 hypothetical protein [Herbiconiux aconitum]
MSDAFDSRHELGRMIADGHLSEEALQAITGLEPEKIRAFLDETKPVQTGMSAEPQVLSGDESMRLSGLAVQLAEGLPIGDDERLKATLESLTVECRLTLQHISGLTGLDVGDVERALRDPRTVPLEKKYELASKASYLINAVNRARGR